MEVLYSRCAGLDVHKETVVACVRLAEGTRVSREVRTFGTTTRELLSLLEWLQEQRVTHAAMESTGVYWKPVWHLVEGHVWLVLGNAKEMQNVPGRKRDVSDAQWIADLLAHGLIRSSFVPPEPIQELRDLTRTRKQLSRERTQHVQRIQKVLEDANVKLSSVLSDLMGKSGRAILEALVRGETHPGRLAALADARVKATASALHDALQGRIREHHRFLVRLHLGQIDGADAAIETLERRIEEVLEPFRGAARHLLTMPGISQTMASAIVAEVGTDMSVFPSAGHLVSWAGLCPRRDESAGKHKNRRTRRQQWLKTMMVQAAWAAARKKNSYLQAQFLRIRARRGEKKAIVAVAASMLTAVYHMLERDVDYQDLSADFFQSRDKARSAQQLRRRLERLGYTVDLRPAA